MPNLPLWDIPYIRTTRQRTQAAQTLEATARTTGGNLKTIRMQHTAADTITLRGIPAVGRYVGGAINGTRPDSICNR